MSRPAQSSLVPPAPIVALAAWLLPGAGHWLLGLRGRGIVIGMTIILLFGMGLLIGGLRVIVPDELIWFVQQICAGPVTLISMWLGQAIDAPHSTARMMEIGTLYAAVAGALNLLAIVDAFHRASLQEERR